MNSFLLLLLSVLTVFAGSLLFVNAVEYIGRILNWSKSFLGAIISPLFTSFPELIVFATALLLADHVTGNEIAIGVIIGQPFMASSVAYGLLLFAIIPSVLLGKRKSKIMQVEGSLAYPYVFLSLLFPLLLLAWYLPRFFSYFLGIGLLASYVFYLKIMWKKNTEIVEEGEEKPFLSRFISPNSATVVQLALSLLLLLYGSNLLVESLSTISSSIGLNALTLSIIVIPLATIIPETITAMIWAYRGKDTLAIGSLVGEKVLYSTLYPGIALLLIPWALNGNAVMSIAFTVLISLIYAYYINRGKFPLYALSFGVVFFAFFTLIVL